MSTMEVTALPQSAILYLYARKSRVQLDPVYQRASEIWNLDKRQLLIDSILNGFDIPKLYFHKLPKRSSSKHDYAIVDGKQRLETIWKFIDGAFPLADDFEYFKDSSVKASGLTYAELSKEHPDLKISFDSYTLSVIAIETDDTEMIEEMFSRLNEAVPLSAAEKRNALPGPIPTAIRHISKHKFFTKKLPFKNQRYRHFDTAAKFLCAQRADKVVDTKKVYLDNFVREFQSKPKTSKLAFVPSTERILKAMTNVFVDADPLLRSVGMVSIYYHLFRRAYSEGWIREISRARLTKFEKMRADNRLAAENNFDRADYDLVEFERYQQSPNDGYAIRFRLKTLLSKAFDRQVSTDDL